MIETKSPITLLAIDDDPATSRLLKEVVSQEGHNILTADSSETGWDLFSKVHPRIVLLGLALPELSGLDLLDRIIASDPACEVILLSDRYTPESAMEAIQKGARDYIAKPIDLVKLRACISEMVVEAERKYRILQLDHQLLETFQFEGLTGRSPLMLNVFSMLRRVGPHFQTVLITGETGTGKELVARALHRLSPASSGHFAECNCAAVVETLFESELFGYVRGAFTGATQDKVGLFEYANGGVLFLDEIGEMPLSTQAKLLRTLQNREIQRVGSPVTRKVEVRVIAATHRDLRALTQQGKFREDLYYRLGTVEISLPRLADRKEDLPLLQRHFVQKYAKQYKKKINGITRRAQAILAAYSWPGNVRELDNVIGRAAMLIDTNIIDTKDLPPHLTSPVPRTSPADDALLTFEELERHHLNRVLAHVGGDKTRAAEILGISRTTLYHFLSKWKDTVPQDSADYDFSNRR